MITGLYFLDVNLGDKMNGAKLAAKIRELDPRGFIIFVTIHLEVARLAFTHRIDAMDFILKEPATNMRSRVEECVDKAYRRYAAMVVEPQNVFAFKSRGIMHSAKTWNIICLEALKAFNKIKLHTVDGTHEFYGSLREAENFLKENFIRCHRSYIINIEHLKKYDRETNIAIMDSGMEIPVSTRKGKIFTGIYLNMARYY